MTHAYLGLFAYDLTATCVGYGVLYGLGVIRTARLALRGVALALFTGLAVLGIWLTTALALNIGVDLETILTMSVALIAVSFGIRRFFPALERAPVEDKESDPLVRGLVVGGGAVLALALASVLVAGVRADADASYDLWSYWLVKAKSIYYFHHLSTGLSGTATYGHISYPLLMPTLSATAFHFMGAAHTELLPLQQCIVVIAFFGSTITLLSSHVPRFVVYPCLAMLVVSPAYWQRVTYVLPDLTLAYFIALAAVAGIIWLDEQRIAWLLLATLFIAAATLIKTEGTPLSVLLIVAIGGAALSMHGRRGLQSGVLLLGVAAIEPWHLWLSSRGLPTTVTVYDWHDFFHFHYLDHRLWRLDYTLLSLERWIFSGSLWLLIPPLTVAAIAILAISHRALAIAVAGWLIAAFFGIASVFWIAKLNLYTYFGDGAYRIMTTLPIVACTLLPLLLGLAISQRTRKN